MQRIYRAGTRTSALALKQVEEIFGMLKKFYPGIGLEVVGIDTYGDRDKVTPISEIEGTDFFTCEIDEALLKGEIDPSTMLRVNGERPSTTLGTALSERSESNGRSRTIDFAIHSAKDLPDELKKGLAIAAITEPIDPYDALISKSGKVLDALPQGARIGTSSLRRKTQLKEYRNDFEIVDIRGNIEERLRELDNRDLDAIVIAACGLIRLGLSYRITQKIPFDILKPHSLQGSLAVVVKKSDIDLYKLLSVLDGAARQCHALARGTKEEILS